MISHLSTNTTVYRLTSQIGRDEVFSIPYDCIQKLNLHSTSLRINPSTHKPETFLFDENSFSKTSREIIIILERTSKSQIKRVGKLNRRVVKIQTKIRRIQ